MPDLISRKRLKKKALDRWENEGGRVCTETTTTLKSDLPKNSVSKGKAAQTSKSVKADSPDECEKTG